MAATGKLLDCGHVDAFAAVCQYEGCGKKLCPRCNLNCDECGRVLCRQHQEWRDDRRLVLCPHDSTTYSMRRLARRLINGGRHERRL